MYSEPSLLDILSYRRPAGSPSEEEFIQRFIVPTGARPDMYGNYILRIGDAPVLWSAHTDTVHGVEGRQRLELRHGLISLHPTEFTGKVFRNKGMNKKYFQSWSTCLGADDGTGVWLLIHMIKNAVPGLYIFHREEETGAQGSNFIANFTPDLLDGIKYAIAFDRRGYDSIVTFQSGGRSASDDFAKELGDRLCLGMKPDDTGMFTDTQSYAHLIPECTNVSVGYHGAHCDTEDQDVNFAHDLLDALLILDLDLPAERDPTQHEELYTWATGRWAKEYERQFGKLSVEWERCDFCGDYFPGDEIVEYSIDYLICERCVKWYEQISEGKYAETG